MQDLFRPKICETTLRWCLDFVTQRSSAMQSLSISSLHEPSSLETSISFASTFITFCSATVIPSVVACSSCRWSVLDTVDTQVLSKYDTLDGCVAKASLSKASILKPFCSVFITFKASMLETSTSIALFIIARSSDVERPLFAFDSSLR